MLERGNTTIPGIPPTDAISTSCTIPFLLCDLRPGDRDKLGNTVQEILWIGSNYAIYRSDKGVYAHFSDCPAEAQRQIAQFTDICPELCELSYLTSQMESVFCIPFLSRRREGIGDALFEHNMAQALMLIMEDKPDAGKQIARQALAMAVRRVTNDNTIRYVVVCLVCAILAIGLGAAAFMLLNLPDTARLFLVAAMSGAIGATFSISTRLEAFELKPCDKSRMNYWMSAVRVGMGVISAVVLLLFASTLFDETIARITKDFNTWQTAAVLGLMGGFAERLIPTLLRRTIDQIDPSNGTPVQAARNEKGTAALTSKSGPTNRLRKQAAGGGPPEASLTAG